jgi:hypothetical protein
MTTVRIAHVEPRPGKLPSGGYLTLGHLVVLADDAGHRAVPVWLRADPGADDLAELVEAGPRPAEETMAAGAPEELTARLLRAAGASVTGVDIDSTAPDASELSPRDTVARIGLSGPAGTRHVTAALGLGLAMAAAAGAPVRLPDEVLDRLAVPVPGEDMLGPLVDRLPAVARVLPPGGGPAGPVGWPVGTLPGQRPRGHQARHGRARPRPGHGGRRGRPGAAARRGAGPAGRTGARRGHARPARRPPAGGRPGAAARRRAGRAGRLAGRHPSRPAAPL